MFLKNAKAKIIQTYEIINKLSETVCKYSVKL